MWKFRPWLVVGQWLLGALLGWGNCSVAAATNTADLVSSNTAFAFSLYSQLGSNGGNIFFSPYSISTCLGMTYAGARGETASQMAEAMDFNTNQTQFGSDFGALQTNLEKRLQSDTNIQFSLANGLWTQEGFPFLPGFLNNATSNFQAVIDRADFLHQSETVRGEINQWVAQKTRGFIVNLLAPGTVTPWTRLVLVNAIYFKGLWANGFKTNDTAVQPFYASPNQTINTLLMHQTTNLGYYHGDLFQAVELPYRGTNVTMVILLPINPFGLGALEASLTPQLFAQAVTNMVGQPVDLFLPRFSVEMTAQLIPDLEQMGMTNAFLPGFADFSGIDGTDDLYINVVAHKAFVDVDESGTVAAAATVVIPPPSVTGPAPITFRADHPFIFMIRDVTSGSILFMGRLAQPAAASSVTVNQPHTSFPAAFYNGLFYDTNGVAFQSSGALNFAVGTTGKFAGQIGLAGRNYAFSGQLYAGADSATVSIKRAHLSDLSVTLEFPPTVGTVGGVVSDGTWTAEIQCVQASAGYSAGHPVPQMGNYTMTLLTGSDGLVSPGYGSFGEVTVMANGGLSLAGLLSDGTVISQASAISTQGYWPLYVPLYAGKGELLGWINFTNQPSSRFNGTATWIKPGAYGQYYTNGFTNSGTVLGSIIHR
jgi:serpin B